MYKDNLSSRPTKVRVGIRDAWDSPSSTVQRASGKLTETLGCKIVPEAEWQALWAQMREQYQGNLDGFVPAIASIVVTWCEALEMRLSNEAEADWTEGFLSLISNAQAQGLKLHIQVCLAVFYKSFTLVLIMYHLALQYRPFPAPYPMECQLVLLLSSYTQDAVNLF